MRNPKNPPNAEIRQKYGFAFADCPRRESGLNSQQSWPFYEQTTTIAMLSGVELRLAELHQQGAYRWKLCGLPDTGFYLLEMIDEMTAKFHPDHKARCAILPPELIVGTSRGLSGGDSMESKWECVPGILSLGEFTYSAPKEADYDCCSVLVTWWQDNFGPPDERATKQISALDLAPYSRGWDF